MVSLKMLLLGFYSKLTVLNSVWKETHVCSINGVYLIWQFLQKSPNRQNKDTVNYHAYMVCTG